MKPLNMIIAIGPGGIIGRNGELPWSINIFPS